MDCCKYGIQSVRLVVGGIVRLWLIANLARKVFDWTPFPLFAYFHLLTLNKVFLQFLFSSFLIYIHFKLISNYIPSASFDIWYNDWSDRYQRGVIYRNLERQSIYPFGRMERKKNVNANLVHNVCFDVVYIFFIFWLLRVLIIFLCLSIIMDQPVRSLRLKLFRLLIKLFIFISPST